MALLLGYGLVAPANMVITTASLQAAVHRWCTCGRPDQKLHDDSVASFQQNKSLMV